MKPLSAFLIGIVLAGLPYPAAADSLAFQEAFPKYVQMRQLEEEELILRERTDLEADTRNEQAESLARKLADARASFQGVLRQHSGDLETWERDVLTRVSDRKKVVPKGLNQTALAYLLRAFPKARSWGPLEWQCVGEWFGQETQDAFLGSAYSNEKVPSVAETSSGETLLIWLNDPFSQFLPKAEADRQKSAQLLLRKQLREQGFRVEDLEINYFSRLEDQAEELHLALIHRSDDRPFLILSTGNASAILLRAFDQNPGLLARKEILGWLNFNGQLYGQEQLSFERKPASLSSRADRQLLEARHQLLLLRKERIGTQTPLGAKFPVINLITTGKKFRPATNLRESILPDARTMFVSDGDGHAALKTALPLLKSHP